MKPKFYWCLVGNGWVAGGCFSFVERRLFSHSCCLDVSCLSKNLGMDHEMEIDGVCFSQAFLKTTRDPLGIQYIPPSTSVLLQGL